VCPRNNPGFDSRRPGNEKPILCYVTDRRGLNGSEDSTEVLLEKIEALAGAGIDWIQIREKDLSGRKATLLVRRALRSAREQTARDHPLPRILVNDRLDVALAEGAGGVHLGENSVRVSEAARLLGAQQAAAGGAQDFLVGVSTHSLEGAKSAASGGASYIFFGPVFATPSKASYGDPQGLDRLAEVCSAVAIPVLAIGGITLENARSCRAAGAAGIAAIRLFQDAPQHEGAIERIRGLVGEFQSRL
jgi:thiamine-phosphate pyrophosphorylase